MRLKEKIKKEEKELKQNILSSLGYNNKIYRKKKSIEKENDNIQKINLIQLIQIKILNPKRQQ